MATALRQRQRRRQVPEPLAKQEKQQYQLRDGHSPLRSAFLTATGSTKVERSGADLIGTVAVDRTEDVLMLFRHTENSPENAIFPPAALRVSVMASACT